MKVVYDDGGRAAAGFRGDAGDCVTRAVAIASGRPYREIYDALAAGVGSERKPKRGRHPGRTAREGILVGRTWFRRYMVGLGFRWVPTMGIGTGCRVHLHDGELPPGRLVVSVSRHYTAVIDGAIHDTHDPQRAVVVDDGRISRRCVYGYWELQPDKGETNDDDAGQRGSR